MAAVPPNSAYDPRNPLGLPPPQLGWRGVPAHPTGLDGNCGPGYQERPAWQTLHLTPLPRSAPSGAHLAAAGQGRSDRSLLNRLLGAQSWDQIRHYAEILLGPQCFELGVCYGIAKNLAQALWGLVDLLKTLILSALYIRATHRPGGWNVFEWTDYWEARAAQQLIGRQMKEAYDQIVRLKAQLAQIMHDPIGFFHSIGTQLKAEYVAKWKRFQQLEQQSSLSSQFEAGEIFGEVLAEVVLTILAVIDGAGVVAKLASKAPELLRIVRTVREVEAAGKAEGVAEASNLAREGDAAGGSTGSQAAQDGNSAQESTIARNQREGAAREQQTQAELQQQYPDASVQREQYLRNSDGTIAKDPLTGEGRRIDHVVIDDGTAVDSTETTSMTADKSDQIAKEARIRENGGTFVRDRDTGNLVDFSNVPTRLIRRP